jgi:peptidoglycan-N-acetylglucosamine deacetylase
MNLKKLLLLLCGFCNLAFANIYSYSAPDNVVQGSVFRSFKQPEIKKYQTAKKYGIIGQIKTRKKIIALTFDDGPDPKYTGEILEILKQHNIHATFFVMGRHVELYPEMVKTTYKNGNVIGNHTYSHPYLTNLSDDRIESELVGTSKLIDHIIGKYPILFRPPYGAHPLKSTDIVNKLGFITITWNDTTNDYDEAQTTPAKIVNAVIKLAKPGAIILLHDGGGKREKTVKALPIIIETLKNEGYEFRTIPEMLKIDGYLPG